MNRVVHFEIHASEPAKIAKFYADVFGWKTQSWAGPVEYWLVTTGPDGAPGINGGVVKRKGRRPGPRAAVNAYVCTVEVADLDATLAKAIRLGAALALPKHAIPGLAWQAYAKDPDGNLFGIHQPDPQAK